MTRIRRLALAISIILTATADSTFAQPVPLLPVDELVASESGLQQRAGALQVDEKALAARGGEFSLFDQVDSSSNWGFTSQDWEKSRTDRNSQGADDFVVPAGATWTITRIFADGFYREETTGPTPLVNVFFYEDDAGRPGAELASVIGVANPDPDFSGGLDIPINVVLSEGTYWVSVQADMDFDGSNGVANQWYWRDSYIMNGAPSHWRNPGGYFERPCPDYETRVAVCGLANQSPPLPEPAEDAGFALFGTAEVEGTDCSGLDLCEEFEAGIPGTWDTFSNAFSTGNTPWAAFSQATLGSIARSSWSAKVPAGEVSEDYFVTPPFPIGAGAFVQFDAAQLFFVEYGSEYEVLVSTTSPTDPAAYTTIGSFVEDDLIVANAGVATFTLDLSAYAGETAYVAFLHRQNDGDVFYLDNVGISFGECSGGCIPVASDDMATVEEDGTVTIDVLGNDEATAGNLDPATVTLISAPEDGSSSVNPAGTVTYTPAADFFGADTFTYTVANGIGFVSNEATVTVAVTPVNDAPVFESEPATVATEDSPYIYEINTSDVEGDALEIAAPTLPSWLTLDDAGDGTATLSGTPQKPNNGANEVALTVGDGGLTTEQAFTVTVSPVDDAPVAMDDEAETPEDVAVTIDVLDNDSDPDTETLTVASAGNAENGTVEIIDGTAVRYTPDADFFGEGAFTYTASDGVSTSGEATVTVTVTPVNDAPTAATITAPEDGSAIELAGDPESPVEVAWTAADDADGDAVSYRWEAVLEGGDFADPLLTVDTDGTSFETTFGVLDAAIAEAGVGAGESAVVEHRVVASDGEAATTGPVAAVTLTRGMPTDAETSPLPAAFAVGGAYPNPSVNTPRIAVDLPWSTEVTVEVYDTVGRRLAERKERFAAGSGRAIPLDGLALPTGVYVYRLTAAAPTGPEVATGRFTVVR